MCWLQQHLSQSDTTELPVHYQYIGVIRSRHFYPQHLVSERDKHASQDTTVSDFKVTDSDQQRPLVAEVKGGSRLSHWRGPGQADHELTD